MPQIPRIYFALAIIALIGAAYLCGRHDGKAALKAEQMAANITGQNKAIDGLRKADNPYENFIVPEIQKIPSVGKTCHVPPVLVSTFRLLPDADGTKPGIGE